MILLIDKPIGMTSHGVVNFVRRVTGVRRVGHGGTLDPNASGLLIVGVGRESTKKLGVFTKETRKTYKAEIVLGEERDTGDIEGTVLKRIEPDKLPDEAKVRQVLEGFIGLQMQTPPLYSAIKIKGKKAYELARRGKKVELMPRKIEVFTAKLLDYHYPTIRASFEVSSGTYIRALARDIGRKLGTVAYLGNLRRMAVGEFMVEDAVEIADLTSDNWRTYAID